MKLLSFLTLLLLAATLLRAEDAPIEPSKTNIFIEMQFVAIPREIALPLVRDLSDSAKIDAAYLRIQELLEKGTAKLLGWPMVTTHSGERATIEAIEEFRYATDFAPGGVDFYLPDSNGVPANKEAAPPIKLDEFQFNAVPTSFETRNTGVTMEVEPKIQADGNTITLEIVPQHVRLKEMTKITIEHEKPPDKVVLAQPRFDTLKSTSGFSIKSGQRLLLGVFQTFDPPDHLEIFILHVEIRKLQ